MGSYEAINGGMEFTAFNMLVGAPYSEYWMVDGWTVTELWEAISSEDGLNSMITVGTYIGTGSHDDYNYVGLPYAHALSVIGTAVIEKDDQTFQRLVKIRNPWGQEYYYGPYSDQSEWTQEELDFLDHELDDDGSYFVKIEDFPDFFESVTIAKDVQGWKRSSFEVLGDDEKHNAQ